MPDDGVIDAARLRAGGSVVGPPSGPGRCALFGPPREVLAAHDAAQVIPLLQRVEALAQRGHWLAGFLAYEAAAAFGLPVLAPQPGLPLAWFGVFDPPRRLPWPPPAPPIVPPAPLPGISRERHAAALAAIHRDILAGDTYQVNFTLPARLDLSPPEEEHDPLATLFLQLQAAHRHPYALWLNSGGFQAASLSPELFLARRGEWLVTGPIKGTRPRGDDPEEDARLARELESSPKERAEHVMIVDMARNDLGRVCRVGSISVPHLLERRTFPTVHHLESRVRGRLRPGVGLAETLAALFPAASITGAPKHRTMAIIRQLENAPRGLYTGCLGVVRPGGDFTFNVAIRTLTRQGNGPVLLGLGGGIVADSRADAEWREVGHKGRFVQSAPPPPGLLETLRLAADGTFPWLDDHLRRLVRSALALGIPCDGAVIRAALLAEGERLAAAGQAPGVVRLTLHPDGGREYVRRPLPDAAPEPLPVFLYPHPVDGRDPLLRHKSTRRGVFEHALALARGAGCGEALLVNGRGHVTEGALRAVLVKLDGRWHAPPLSDGLLPSLWRRRRMAELGARVRHITVAELARAEALEMGNAVRGGGAARVVNLPGPGRDGGR